MKNKILSPISGIFFAAVFISAVSIFPSCHSATQQKTTADTTAVPQVKTNPVQVDTSLTNGIITERYDNGVMLKKGDYFNGKKEGQWDSWYKTGKPWSENFYKDDLPDGKSTVWYENGKIEYTGFYTMGKQIGKWTYSDSTGKVVKVKDYGK